MPSFLRPALAVAALALAWLASGCGGYSYVYRSPLERPLDGVRRVGVRLEALVPHGQDALARRLTSREDALVDWLGREGRAASFAPLAGGEDATIHVLLIVEPRPERPDPRLVITDSVRIAIRILVQRGTERVAVLEGTASTRAIFFHGLVDPDLPIVFERIAHRLSRMLEDLGLPGRP